MTIGDLECIRNLNDISLTCSMCLCHADLVESHKKTVHEYHNWLRDSMLPFEHFVRSSRAKQAMLQLIGEGNMIS